MIDKSKKQKNRLLVAVLALIAIGGILSLNNSSASNDSGELANLGIVGNFDVHQGNQYKERINLKEPGPMIPPMPAILLTVNGENEGEDEISVVWTFVVNGNPPQVGISVEDPHVALAFLKRHREFVLNVPTADMIKQFDKVDMNSSKIGNKFELSGLTRGKASKVNAPTVEESPIHLECKVFDLIRVEPMRTIFLADVVATRVLEGTCDENGRLIVDATSFFGMTAGSGEFYTMGKRIGHIGQSVGRSDIKY